VGFKTQEIHNTLSTKYPIPHKIYWNGIPTQNNADRPYIATRRTLQIDLA
jgi:hypothetical protein